MNLRRGDGVVLVAAALAAGAAAVTAVVGTRAGVVTLALALSLGLAGLARVSGVVLAELGRQSRIAAETRKVASATRRMTARSRPVLRASRRQAKRAAEVARRVELRTRDQDRQLSDLRGEQGTARRRADSYSTRILATLDTMPSDTVRLTRVADRVAPGATDLPGLGQWALSAGTLLALVEEVYARPGPVTILECGSGSSTLFFALALAERGHGGRVVSLESSAEFGARTRENLRRHGVDALASVVDAPLVEQQVPAGTTHLWFDLTDLPDVHAVDLLLVDGPVGDTSPQARYPALPLLAPRLAPGALVVLDDTNRPDEQQILERWLADDHGVRLTVEGTVGRSTFLRADAREPERSSPTARR